MNEIAFLNKLLPSLKCGDEVVVPPGDDCAAVRWRDGKLLLLAVDQLIAEQHFVVADTEPSVAGRKLLARNLSDIAAMGGTPLYALVTSAASQTYTQQFHEQFMSGIMALAEEQGVQIIGGDIAGNPEGLVATLTIVGEVAEDKVVRRNTVRPGDVLFVTGTFGDSFPTNHHLNFMPRMAEGKWVAENGFAAAMLDVSDGPLLDATRLCRESGVSLCFEAEKLPARVAGASVKSRLIDGEDYELLFAVRPDKVESLKTMWPFETKLTAVGCFGDDGVGVIKSCEGEDLNQKYAPFDHFSEAAKEEKITVLYETCAQGHEDVGMVIAAAGSSSRFGKSNKLLSEFTLNGLNMPLICFTIKTFSALIPATRLILVISADARHEFEALLNSWRDEQGRAYSDLVTIVEGGETRQQSVSNGLQALPDVDLVAVHDGARPRTTVELLKRCVATARKCGGAIAANRVVNTIKKVAPDGTVLETVDRDGLAAVETPQVFKRTALIEAYRQVEGAGVKVTDEAGAMQYIGLPVQIVFHEENNQKVTFLKDIDRN